MIFAPATAGSSLTLAAAVFTGGVADAVGNVAAGVLADNSGGIRIVALGISELGRRLARRPAEGSVLDAVVRGWQAACINRR
ncbi:hypothetical protein [Phytoactinopolyspora mesophila]|uniref:Uncharacterized protein n=1 Tax=Phytoactinopolyspora mesophila TaxID=2650750 RepID=A0A7K3M2Y4_9ACTN|nr:hypothetical protein [Phytoactinopolyspora mesophila]NDL57639.1 hypothetical protein [Phytoactinopolyspora mesophila]